MAAAIAGSLSLIASRILQAPDSGSWAFLAASGTFIIYGLDRLRDIDRDRVTSPLRTAFVVRNRRQLYIAVGLAAIGFVATLLAAPAKVILLCLAIGLVGLLHRRLKEVAALKAAYVSLAWVMACMGMPWLVSERGAEGPWLASILFASLAANLIASNLREEEGDGGGTNEVVLRRATAILWLARGMTVLAIVLTLTAPSPLHALVWIPLCEGLALACFRPSERYHEIAVDGGLLVGAIVTAIHLGVAALGATA